MKKALFIILVILVVYVVILVAPVGVFLHQISSLEFSGDALHDQLSAISSISISEDPGETDVVPTSQALTLTVTDENISTMLYNALIKQKRAFMAVEQVDTNISPEMIHLAISSRYGLFGYLPYETTVFSEWMVKVSPNPSDPDRTSVIEIKPVNIHTNHLYTVNFAKFWKYATKTDVSDGWFALPSSIQFQIQYLILKDHEISLSIAF